MGAAPALKGLNSGWQVGFLYILVDGHFYRLLPGLGIRHAWITEKCVHFLRSERK